MYSYSFLKIQIFTWSVFLVAVVVAYLFVSETLSIKYGRHLRIFIKCLFFLWPILQFYYLNLPVLKDISLKRIVVKEALVSDIRVFPPGCYFLDQQLYIDGLTYHVVFSSEILTKGDFYKVHFLEESRFVVKIDKI